MRIRRARPDDAEGLFELRRRALSETGAAADALTVESFRRQFFEAEPTPSVYLSIDGDDLLGFSAADPKNGRILGVWVDPDVAGRGLGSALLGHAEWAASQEGVDRLTVECRPAVAEFFEKNDYQRDEDASGEEVLLVKQVPDPTRDF